MEDFFTLDYFRQTNTKTRKDGSVRVLACYREKYGGMPFEQAYQMEVARRARCMERRAKIDRFEKFLQGVGAKMERSHFPGSDSRYYFWNMKKYRFSGHYYPTGSMTNDHVVDFAADPQLIDSINF